MKKIFLYFLIFALISCKQTPKVEVEDDKSTTNEILPVDQNESTLKNDASENHLKTSDTLAVDTAKVDTLRKDSEKDKKFDEKKKEDKKTEPEVKEPDFPDLPETDVYNPKEDPAPNEFVLVDREAKPKNLEAIIEEIKADAKLYGVKGKAVVGILVSTHGNYLKHYFFGVTNKKLEYIVADNIQNLKFRPATLNGQPVKMWFKTTIEIK